MWSMFVGGTAERRCEVQGHAAGPCGLKGANLPPGAVSSAGAGLFKEVHSNFFNTCNLQEVLLIAMPKSRNSLLFGCSDRFGPSVKVLLIHLTGALCMLS